MSELLQPRTDAGVLAQAAIVGLVLAVALYRVRRDRDARLLVLGSAVFLLGLFVLRAAH